MRETGRRVARLEQAAGTSGRSVLLVARDDGDGGWRDLVTDAIQTPPARALVVVIAECPDGPP